MLCTLLLASSMAALDSPFTMRFSAIRLGVLAEHLSRVPYGKVEVDPELRNCVVAVQTTDKSKSTIVERIADAVGAEVVKTPEGYLIKRGGATRKRILEEESALIQGRIR